MYALHPTGQGGGMKENHGLQLRSKSYNDHNKGPASVHSLLTQDSEICQKEKSQRTCLSTLVSIPCGWRGVVGWSLFLKLETFFFCCNWNCKCCFGWDPSGILVFSFPRLTPLMCQSVNFRCWLLTLNWVKAHSQQWKKQSRQASHRKRIRPLSPLRGLGKWSGTNFQLSMLSTS